MSKVHLQLSFKDQVKNTPLGLDLGDFEENLLIGLPDLFFIGLGLQDLEDVRI